MPRHSSIVYEHMPTSKKRFQISLELIENKQLNHQYVLLVLKGQDKLPQMLPGQFVQVLVEDSPTTYLRRPISINFVDTEKNTLWLLVQIVGDGTRTLAKLQPGSFVNLLLPLGNHFDYCETDQNILLIGGGVGVAPLLMFGRQMHQMKKHVTFLLGARSANDLLELELFQQFGTVYTTTEDGTHGEKGYVTQHSILKTPDFDRIATCGPKAMMKAVAAYAKENQIECEVSLENTMACGIGACLCCVEDTVDGHVCTCTEGPVFNLKKLKW